MMIENISKEFQQLSSSTQVLQLVEETEKRKPIVSLPKELFEYVMKFRRDPNYNIYRDWAAQVRRNQSLY